MTNTLHFTLLAASLSLACLSSAQWKDRKFLDNGGESTVATDGKGSVYVTTHIPCKLFESHDFGASFIDKMTFDDGACDMDVLAWPDGQVNVSYIKSGITGFASYFSSDNGATITQGSAPSGQLDREWLAPNLVNGDLYMDFSDGFIGGPKSIGVFLATSKDHGKTFTRGTRIDKEPAGDFPVDPYLQSSSDGRIYAMWATSKDYDTMDRFDFAYSTDNGQTFTGHQSLCSFNKSLGTTQERWILGNITAYGKDKLLLVFPNYEKMTVDGKEYTPLLMYYRLSSDGGKTFSDPKLVSPRAEIEANIRSFAATVHSDRNFGYYLQTLPWACVDGRGHFHIVYQDNRDGQVSYNNDYFDQWNVRFATLKEDSGFGQSEKVSDDYTAIRPPLDFESCCADSQRVYVSWTECPGVTAGWPFNGKTYIGRRPLTSQD
ncbi:MAG TPA: sialidase family protein [Fimbriimonadaceae bacterium]|jgi:hypothetical protein